MIWVFKLGVASRGVTETCSSLAASPHPSVARAAAIQGLERVTQMIGKSLNRPDSLHILVRGAISAARQLPQWSRSLSEAESSYLLALFALGSLSLMLGADTITTTIRKISALHSLQEINKLNDGPSIIIAQMLFSFVGSVLASRGESTIDFRDPAQVLSRVRTCAARLVAASETGYEIALTEAGYDVPAILRGGQEWQAEFAKEAN